MTENISSLLRVAFIGAGNMATMHLHALRRVATLHRVVGVHDARPEAAASFAERAGARAYPSVTRLLESERPDLVHVCTPAGHHFEPAREALLAGAHVYVEKPFVETAVDAETLIRIASERGRIICAGHQLLRDTAFEALLERAIALQPITLVDSYFAFRSPRLEPGRSPNQALAAQLLDIVPHPLYTLVAALEAFGGPEAEPELLATRATATDLHALLRAGAVSGRLAVSLTARPVASTLTVSGAQGTLTAEFVRSIVLGAANAGTTPLEKIANPFLEAGQLAWRSALSLVRRLASGADYPGLAELLGAWYRAAAAGQRSPLSIGHLRAVTRIYEELAAHVRHALAPRVTSASVAGPVAVVTGAGGFFGRAISRELARRGYRVRGMGRSEGPDDANIHEWVRADLTDGIQAGALADAALVVHAAAETAGGFEAHERNTVQATRRLVEAMAASGVRRLLLVSSLSVVQPPRSLGERQSERTPRAGHAERLGAYTWGKCVQEEVAEAAHREHAIDLRIIRPAALIDWERLELPGLLGRRLFGRWHLGLGRPGLPFAMCEVGRAAAVVGWYADHFAAAPPVVNLIDPAIATRGQLLAAFREHGWRGRVLWVPISLLAAMILIARRATALLRRGAGALPPLSPWAILRPRRYDTTVATEVLAAAGDVSGRDTGRAAAASDAERRRPAYA